MSQRSDYKVNITITSKDKTGQATKRATTGMAGLKKVLGGVAVAYGVLKSAQAAVDFVKAGAAVKRQAGALNNLARAAGTSGEAIVSAIQTASDHTIDRMTAMSVANKALLLNVAQTPEQFSELTRVATLLGRAMGQDAASSINDFVVAAGRQSVMIADNLGLMVSAETANQRYADSHGILVSAMGKAEKSQAFLNEMLIQGAEKTKDLETATLDAATRIEQAEADVADIKTGFKELALEIAVSTGTLDRWNKLLNGGNKELEDSRTAVAKLEDVRERDRLAMERAIKATDALNVTSKEHRDIVFSNHDAEILLAQAMEATSSEVYIQGESFTKSLPAMRDYHSLMEDAIQANKDAIVTAKDMAEARDIEAEAVEKAAEAQERAKDVALRTAMDFTRFQADKAEAAADFAKTAEEIETEHQEKLAKIAKRGQSTAIKFDEAGEQEKLKRLQENLGVALQRQTEFTDKTAQSTRMAKENQIARLNEQIAEQTTLLDNFHAGRLVNQGENISGLLTAEEARYAEEKRLLDVSRAEQELAQKQSLGRMLLQQLESWATTADVAPDELRQMKLDLMEEHGLITEEGRKAADEYAKKWEPRLATLRSDVDAFFVNFHTQFNGLPDEKVIRIRTSMDIPKEVLDSPLFAGTRPGSGQGSNVPGGAIVPGMAAGGVAGGGRSLVGELGPEFVDMPRGSMVHNANTTSNMMNSQNTYNVNDPAGAAMMVEQARAASQSRFARGAGM